MAYKYFNKIKNAGQDKPMTNTQLQMLRQNDDILWNDKYNICSVCPMGVGREKSANSDFYFGGVKLPSYSKYTENENYYVYLHYNNTTGSTITDDVEITFYDNLAANYYTLTYENFAFYNGENYWCGTFVYTEGVLTTFTPASYYFKWTATGGTSSLKIKGIGIYRQIPEKNEDAWEYDPTFNGVCEKQTELKYVQPNTPPYMGKIFLGTSAEAYSIKSDTPQTTYYLHYMLDSMTSAAEKSELSAYIFGFNNTIADDLEVTVTERQSAASVTKITAWNSAALGTSMVMARATFKNKITYSSTAGTESAMTIAAGYSSATGCTAMPKIETVLFFAENVDTTNTNIYYNDTPDISVIDSSNTLSHGEKQYNQYYRIHAPLGSYIPATYLSVALTTSYQTITTIPVWLKDAQWDVGVHNSGDINLNIQLIIKNTSINNASRRLYVQLYDLDNGGSGTPINGTSVAAGATDYMQGSGTISYVIPLASYDNCAPLQINMKADANSTWYIYSICVTRGGTTAY